MKLQDFRVHGYSNAINSIEPLVKNRDLKSYNLYTHN